MCYFTVPDLKAHEFSSYNNNLNNNNSNYHWKKTSKNM